MRDANPFYFTDPSVGRIATGLAALFNPPQAEREMQLARANLYTAYAEAQRAALAGQQALAARLAAGLEGDRAARWRDIFAAAASTGRPEALRNIVGLFAATQGVPEEELARIVVGGGGDWGHTESGTRFTVGAREATRRREQDLENAYRRYRVDMEAAMLRDRIAAEEAGRNRRYSITLRPGEIAIVPPDSPLAPSVGAEPLGASSDGPVYFRSPEEAIEWGRRERAALDPGAPDYLEQVQRINNIVVQHTMPTRRPQPIRLEGPPARPSFDQVRAQEVERYIRGEGTPDELQRRGHVVAPFVERQRIVNQGRLEQIALQGENARELQALRDEAAAGRLAESGRQRLEQLERQNLARLEQIALQGDIARGLQAMRDEAATGRAVMAGQQRLEQIALQGENARELQALRDEAAAGRLAESGRQRLEQLERQNQARLEQIALQGENARGVQAMRDEAAADRLSAAGQQRLGQIVLRGEIARELQALRDEAAAGRLAESGRQRLEQLERQNRARLEQIALQGDLRRQERQEEPVRPADLRAIDDLIAAQASSIQLPDGNTYRLDPAAIAVVRRRAVDLFRSSPDPEVRGNHAEAAAQALEEFLASGPRRSGSFWPFGSRTLSPPLPSPSVRAGAEPSASTGAGSSFNATQRLQQLGIPPPAEREVGRIYQTPIGPMRWDGQRWQRP